MPLQGLKYPYLESKSGDMTMRDVDRLLSLYKDVVHKYTTLCRAISHLSTSEREPLLRHLELQGADSILASLFIVSVTWVVANLCGKLCRHYIGKVKRLQPSTTLIVNIIRIAISIVGFLILLDMWGVPTTPILLFLFAAILLAVLACRNLIVNIFSGLQLARGEHIEVDDFVRLGSGEEGYITEISWQTTQIRALDGNLIIVPNGRLLQSTVINYGRPLVKAQAPFKFYSLVHLKELTGLHASNLTELVSILKKVPGSVIYHHTHNFLEEYQYLTPEPANDFSLWVYTNVYLVYTLVYTFLLLVYTLNTLRVYTPILFEKCNKLQVFKFEQYILLYNNQYFSSRTNILMHGLCSYQIQQKLPTDQAALNLFPTFEPSLYCLLEQQRSHFFHHYYNHQQPHAGRLDMK